MSKFNRLLLAAAWSFALSLILHLLGQATAGDLFGWLAMTLMAVTGVMALLIETGKLREN